MAADVGQSKEKLLIKFDPRDLSRIFVRRPSGSFVEARYRDLGWPSISLAEQRAYPWDAVAQLDGEDRASVVS